MFRSLYLIFLLIILVCLSWISFTYAQDISITRAFLLGQESSDFYKKNLRKVNPKMCRKPVFLLKEVADAFEKMYRAAEKEGFRLTLISGFRSFSHQKRIWQKKHKTNPYLYENEEMRILKIMEYSAMPGTSRHHWGSDIDVVSLKNSFFEKGYGQEVFLWLKKNGNRFGFRQVYTAGRAHGYKEERWHFTYFPLSTEYLMAYKKQIQPSDIYGFSGDLLVGKLDIIEKYVLGINPELLEKTNMLLESKRGF